MEKYFWNQHFWKKLPDPNALYVWVYVVLLHLAKLSSSNGLQIPFGAVSGADMTYFNNI